MTTTSSGLPTASVLYTIGLKRDRSQRFTPGSDTSNTSPNASTVGRVGFISFELSDKFRSIASLKMTYDDPEFVLVNHPFVKDLESTIEFRFGFEGAYSPKRSMLLVRTEQSYPMNGRVQTVLRFFDTAMSMGQLRRNEVYTHTDPAKRGQKLLASDIAALIAIRHGLTPIVTPCREDAGSAKFEWRQTNETDIQFLRRCAVGLRSASDGDGHPPYVVNIEGEELHFGPPPKSLQGAAVLVYRDPASPLRSFTPQLPADLTRGLGISAGLDGVDNTGARQVVDIDPAKDASRVTFGVGSGDQRKKEETSGRVPPRTMAPWSAFSPQDPVASQRYAAYTQVRDTYLRGINAARTVLLRNGQSPAAVEEALSADKAAVADLDAHYKDIMNGASLNNLAIVTGTLGGSANGEGAANTQTAQDMSRTALDNAMTATAELWGQPLLRGGNAVVIKGVADRFAGTWWMESVTHMINRDGGYITRLELNKNGFVDTTPNGTRQAQPKLTNVTVRYVVDGHTGSAGFRVVPTRTLSDNLAKARTVNPGLTRATAQLYGRPLPPTTTNLSALGNAVNSSTAVATTNGIAAAVVGNTSVITESQLPAVAKASGISVSSLRQSLAQSRVNNPANNTFERHLLELTYGGKP